MTQQAIDTARDAGLQGDVEHQIIRMVASAALITHTLGNRRFEQYVFDVAEDRVLSVHRISEGQTIRRKKKTRYNEAQIIEDYRNR